jgi:hypothetical protein
VNIHFPGHLRAGLGLTPSTAAPRGVIEIYPFPGDASPMPTHAGEKFLPFNRGSIHNEDRDWACLEKGEEEPCLIL